MEAPEFQSPILGELHARRAENATDSGPFTEALGPIAWGSRKHRWHQRNGAVQPVA